MNIRTVLRSTFDEYIADDDSSMENRAAEEVDRAERLARFPHSIMLKVSFPKVDFANRWCWQNLGPSDGECTQRFSAYAVCDRPEPHSHVGKWTSYWFVRIDYDFGFNEWYFAERADCDLFIANVDNIHWGEHYPK